MEPASVKEAKNGWNGDKYITPRTLKKVLENFSPSEPGAGGTKDYNELINLPQINGVTLKGNTSLSTLGVQPAGDYASKSDIPSLDGYLTTQDAQKTYQPKGNYQDTLVSGNNIKTINGTSLLGSGDVTIPGGGSPINPYPVGSIYISVNDVNPSTFFGGEWERIKDKFLLSSGDTYQAGTTGGEAEHTLTVGEMPKHKHSIYQHVNGYNFAVVTSYGESGGYAIATGGTNGGVSSLTPESGDTARGLVNADYTGVNEPHNNMPPYLTVYMWKRIA